MGRRRDGETCVWERTTDVGVMPLSSAASAMASTASALVMPGAAVITNACSCSAAAGFTSPKSVTSVSISIAFTSSTVVHPTTTPAADAAGDAVVPSRPARGSPAQASLSLPPEHWSKPWWKPWVSSASKVSNGSDRGTIPPPPPPPPVGAGDDDDEDEDEGDTLETSIRFTFAFAADGRAASSSESEFWSRASATRPSPATALLPPPLLPLPALETLLTLPGDAGGLWVVVIAAGYSAAGGETGTCAHPRSDDDAGDNRCCWRCWRGASGEPGTGGTVNAPSPSHPSSGSTTQEPWLEVGEAAVTAMAVILLLLLLLLKPPVSVVSTYSSSTVQ